MKILDVTLFYPPQIGGAVTTTTEIVNALKRKDYRVEILAPKDNRIFTGIENINDMNDDLINKKEENIYRVHVPKRKGKWLMIVTYSLFSMFKLKGKNFHLIIGHFHFNSGAGWASYIISKILKVPFILRIHDVYEPITLKEKMMFIVNKIPLKKATKLLTINTPSKEFLESNKYNKSENILVIPNGVSNLTKMKNTIDNKVKRICFIGTLSKDRGLDKLFSLVDILEKKNIHLKIHVIGDGPEFENLKGTIENNPLYKNKITLHGAYTRKKATQVLSEMDISIGVLDRNRTNDYQLLIKLIESIHLGIPWVSISTKGVKQFNIETDTGIEIETLDQFADAIELLINDDNFYKNKVNNCLENSKKFDWDKISLELDTIIKNTL